jgi:hypothetical protein
MDCHPAGAACAVDDGFAHGLIFPAQQLHSWDKSGAEHIIHFIRNRDALERENEFKKPGFIFPSD